MDRKTAWALAMLASSMVFFSVASAADDGELMEMRDAVVAVGGDWAAIEMFLATLSPEERELVIATYPERIAELEEIRRAIEESGADWTAGLNPVSILPPELRPGTGRFSVSDEAGGVPRETVTVGPGEGGLATLELPDSWDWRDVDGINWTTPIKDEGLCGASWAFAPLGAIEARVKLAANNPNLVPDFSEQYLLSCCPFGNCSEANLEGVADWIVCQGTVDEACFPYAEDDEIPCSESCFDRDSRKYKSEGWYWVCGNWYTADADSIKREVLSGGPVSSFMEVYTDFWYYNESDIYEQTYGDYQGDLLVDIVGWGNESGKDYWICKNSWGTGWGDQGWFKIKMGEVSIGTRTMGYVPKIRGKVLFYEGHSPFYGYNLGANYSEWGNRLASNGYLVHSSSTAPLTADLLSCYDVVIISNPGEGFSADELAAIKEFVGRGRVIASGDGDLFANEHIYKQDNERMAVEYVDWLATGEGGGLLIMGGEYVDWLGPIGTGAGTGTETETDGPEPLIGNDNATQVSDLFGLHINTDVVADPLRYDGEKGHVILGPEDDVLVINGSSLSISKDAFALARTTPSGYVTAGGPGPQALPHDVDGADLTPEEMPLSVMAAEEIPPEEMPPAGDLSPEGEPTIAPAEELGMEVSSELVPMAGLSFTGPIVIAAIDFGRKGEDAVGVFRDGAWLLDYDNDGIADLTLTFGLAGDRPVSGDWSGDGKDTLGVFKDGVWNMDYNNDGIGDSTVNFGAAGDIPVTGDWNGDGRDTIGVFKDGVWNLDYNNDGIVDSTVNFGAAGDIPVTGDWNGDGRDTIGVFKDGVWSLDYNNDGTADLTVNFGSAGDIPVTGDWNGDGRDTVGVFRDGVWRLDYDNDEVVDSIISFGSSGDIPIAGDFFKNPSVSTDMVAYYPFDGDANDASGNGNHGTVYGAALTADRFGNPNRAYLFDGISNYIQAPVNINPDVMPQATLTAWVRADEASPVRQVISTDDGGFDRSLCIDFRGGGAGWSAFGGSGGVLGYHPVDTGEWTFLAVVYDQNANSVKLYVNGDTYEGTGVLGQGHEQFNIGSGPTFGEYFSGAIDDVSVYDRALSSAEIADLYQNDGLAVNYPFDGSADDASGNGNHGTVYGAVLTADRHGNPNSAYQFDGIDDYIHAPVNINPDAMPRVTMIGWVKADSASPVKQVISTDNSGFDRSLCIDFRGGGAGWSAFSGTGGVLGYHPVNIGEWTFLAVVYDQDADTVRLHVNGDTYEGSGVLGQGHEYFNIGSGPTFGEYFSGVIDEVRIYNRALSSDQVQSLYLG